MLKKRASYAETLLWCMVGRERFERSTSGLKVIDSIMSPIITTRPKDSLLYLLHKVIMP